MEVCSGNFINVLDLTRSSCKECNYRLSGRNRTCGPAIISSVSLGVYIDVIPTYTCLIPRKF